jgi:TM2 domain-containing membrane protein YozV
VVSIHFPYIWPALDASLELRGDAKMTLKNVATGLLLYAIASLLFIFLLGPSIAIGVVALMGFLMVAGLLSSLLRK